MPVCGARQPRRGGRTAHGRHPTATVGLRSAASSKEGSLNAVGTSEATAVRTQEFDAAAEVVWRLLADLGAIADWWPGGFADIDVRDGPDGRAIRTLVRHDGSVVVETIHEVDEPGRMLLLSVDSGMPASVRDYTCRYTVVADGPHRCRLEWQPSARLGPDGAAAFEAVVAGGWAKVSGGLLQAVAPA